MPVFMDRRSDRVLSIRDLLALYNRVHPPGKGRGSNGVHSALSRWYPVLL